MSYNGLTNQGLEYLTRCQAESKPVTFSKVKIGNGNIPIGSTGETTTDLYSFKKDIEILSKTQVKNSIKMEILINNFDVLEEFYVKEIGVYVMDNGIEKLYWYINKDKPSPLPDKNTPAKHRYILHLETSQMESIILNYTGTDLLVDKEFVEEKLNEVKDRTKALQFSDIESMKQKNLKVGDIVEVLGYYTTGDGAGHKRIIANEDDGSGVQLVNKLWANIVHNGEINVSWFGAKGDGVTDDSSFIQSTINFCKNKYRIIMNGIFLLKNSITIYDNTSLTGTGAHSTIIKNDSNIETLIKIENDNETYGNNIIIKNLTLLSDDNYHCYGILFDSSSVMYHKLENIKFKNFHKSCILIRNDGNKSRTRSYCHNMIWKTIITEGCSSIVQNETINSGEPTWFYGGIVEDLHFEGYHYEDKNNYILDLSGWRNVEFKNTIIEGKIFNEKKSIFYIDNPIHINSIYFEIVDGDKKIKNSFVLKSEGKESVIDNVYGTMTNPILTVDSGSNIPKISFCYPQRSKYMLDINSKSAIQIKHTIQNKGFKNLLEDNVLNSKIKYNSVSLGDKGVFLINEANPYISVDLSNFEKYSPNITFLSSSSLGKITYSKEQDPIYGTVLRISNNSNNLLYLPLILNHKALGIDFPVTLVITYKLVSQLNNEEECNLITDSYTYSFDNTNLVKDKMQTVVKYFSEDYIKSYNFCSYYFGKIHSKPLPNDSDYPKQEIIIYDISYFKGFRYRNCKSKLNTDNFV